MATAPKVFILVGSDTDLVTMAETCTMLDKFKVPFEIHVSSAHRTPARTVELVEQAEKKGVRVYIAAAGGAAHLAGVVAGHTSRPVIGVPMPTLHLGAADSLYATVQMPPGIPVATVSIGKWGAINAGILAAQILAQADEDLALRLKDYKKDMASKVMKKDALLQSKGVKQYLEDM